MFQEAHEIKCVMFIGGDRIEMVTARVGDGWTESIFESTVHLDLLVRGQMHLDTSGHGVQHMIHELATIRDDLYSKYGLIPVEIYAGSALRTVQNRSEFNWMVEEATGYRVMILSEQEELTFSIYNALQKSPVNTDSFNELIKEIENQNSDRIDQ